MKALIYIIFNLIFNIVKRFKKCMGKNEASIDTNWKTKFIKRLLV